MENWGISKFPFERNSVDDGRRMKGEVNSRRGLGGEQEMEAHLILKVERRGSEEGKEITVETFHVSCSISQNSINYKMLGKVNSIWHIKRIKEKEKVW